MKSTPWTATEEKLALELREIGHSYAEIARRMGRTVKAVEIKFWKMSKLGDQWEPREPASITNGPEVSKEEFERRMKLCESAPQEKTAEERADYWRREAQRLQGVLSNQQHDKTAVEILVEKAVELAPISYQPVKQWAGMVGRGGSSQSAVLIFSDTHIGQVVKSEQTLGMGGYDFEIFLRRLGRLQQSIFSILGQHTTTKIDEIVVAMLGDMLHGNLTHAVEAGQVNTLFNQFYSAGHAIVQFLRNLSTLAPVRVHTAVGNHPRWGTQKKMPTDNRYSNLDQFLYSYLAALLRDEPRVSIKLDEQPFSRFDVQGFHFLAGHGDHLRGGDKNLGIPNHAIGRNVNVHSQLAMRSGSPVPNYYLVGHLHRPITIPHCMGEFVVNGGFPGIDGYALAEAFNSSYPSQKFFLMHPKFGRSATYDLRLDLGDGTPHGYSLPTEFCCK